MTRPYTLTFYVRIVRLYQRMPAKEVARIMQCAESTVRSAKYRLSLATNCNVPNLQKRDKLAAK